MRCSSPWHLHWGSNEKKKEKEKDRTSSLSSCTRSGLTTRLPRFPIKSKPRPSTAKDLGAAAKKALIFNASADEYKKEEADDERKERGIFLFVPNGLLASYFPFLSSGIAFIRSRNMKKKKKEKKKDGSCHNLSVVSAREAGLPLAGLTEGKGEEGGRPSSYIRHPFFASRPSIYYYTHIYRPFDPKRRRRRPYWYIDMNAADGISFWTRPINLLFGRRGNSSRRTLFSSSIHFSFFSPPPFFRHPICHTSSTARLLLQWSIAPNRRIGYFLYIFHYRKKKKNFKAGFRSFLFIPPVACQNAREDNGKQ